MTPANLATAVAPVQAPAELLVPGSDIVNIAALRAAIKADLAAASDAKAARAGHRCRQRREADEVHAALDDRVLDAEQLGDAGLHAGSLRV